MVISAEEKLLSKALASSSPLIANYVKDGAGLEYAIGQLQEGEDIFVVSDFVESIDDPVLAGILIAHSLDPKYLGAGIESEGRRKLLKAGIPLAAFSYCGARALNGAVSGDSGELAKYSMYILGIAGLTYRNIEDDDIYGKNNVPEFFHQRIRGFLEDYCKLKPKDSKKRLPVVDYSAEAQRQREELRKETSQ